MLRIFTRTLSAYRYRSDPKESMLSQAAGLVTNPKGSDFLNQYFRFSRSCRLAGKIPRETLTPSEMQNFVVDLKMGMSKLTVEMDKLTELSRHSSSRIRAARSGISFLEEDIIKEEESLHSPWRELMCSPLVWHVNERLSHYFWVSDDYCEADLRAVPKNHCWWRDWEFRWSEETYGPNIYPDDLQFHPIVPDIAVTEEREKFYNLIFVYNATSVKRDIEALLAYFKYSQACRELSEHPLVLFEFECAEFSEWVAFGGRIENAVKDALENENVFDLKTIRSAIEFLEEEVVANIAETDQNWRELRGSEAFQKLDWFLKQQSETQELDEMNYIYDFRSVPISHWWWSTLERALSNQKYPSRGNPTLVPFTIAMKTFKKQTFFFLEKFSISRDQNSGLNFVDYFGIWASEVLQYRKDPLIFLRENEIEELLKLLRLVIPHFSQLVAVNLPPNKMKIYEYARCGMDLLATHVIRRHPDLHELCTENVLQTGVIQKFEEMFNYEDLNC